MTMNSIFKVKATLLSLVACILLVGCQTSGDGGKADADPRLTKSDSASFFTKAGAQGCAAGALTGVLACALTNSSNKAACMAIAATAGCAAGATTAYVIDSRRASYSNKETSMNTIIKDVQEDNDKLKKRSVVVEEVMRDNQKTLDSLAQQIRIKQVDQKNARAQLRVIKANKELLDSELRELDARNTLFQDVIEKKKSQGAQGSQEVRQLQRQVDELTAKKKSLEELRDISYSQLSAVNASMGNS